MPFNFKKLEIPDVILITPAVFKDDRGFFMECYKYSEFSSAGIKEYFVQDNHSKSSRGVLRGLHYQKNPHAQGKLIRCLRGNIFDVAVDIRRGSESYGRWVSVELSEENNNMLYVPPSFAHGFVVLSESAEIVYKCTKEYSPKEDRGIRWDDPDIRIDWPIKNPHLSGKDISLPLLIEAENNFVFEQTI